jgi:hypothetical protein
MIVVKLTVISMEDATLQDHVEIKRTFTEVGDAAQVAFALDNLVVDTIQNCLWDEQLCVEVKRPDVNPDAVG